MANLTNAQRVLDALKDNGWLTAAEISTKTGLLKRQINSVTTSLKRQGKLVNYWDYDRSFNRWRDVPQKWRIKDK